jgi:hypothetical protein
MAIIEQTQDSAYVAVIIHLIVMHLIPCLADRPWPHQHVYRGILFVLFRSVLSSFFCYS